ncbi:MAG: hypothetical protein JXM69_02575 [Anaerolineae bacterium]|nr:hypothetical protein [Anaerolineae bacterium]
MLIDTPFFVRWILFYLFNLYQFRTDRIISFIFGFHQDNSMYKRKLVTGKFLATAMNWQVGQVCGVALAFPDIWLWLNLNSASQHILSDRLISWKSLRQVFSPATLAG